MFSLYRGMFWDLAIMTAMYIIVSELLVAMWKAITSREFRSDYLRVIAEEHAEKDKYWNEFRSYTRNKYIG